MPAEAAALGAAGSAAGATVIIADAAGEAAAVELLSVSLDSLATVSVASVELTEEETTAYFMRLGEQMITQMYLA